MEKSNTKTIILVDDDDVLSRMYKTKLETSGFIVKTASNGTEGLELIKNETANLLILDIMMPQMTGLELLEKLRATKKEYANIPVIMLTNLTEKEQQAKAAELGVKEFLIKADLTPQALVEAIQKYL